MVEVEESEGRYKTAAYMWGGKETFTLFEHISKGTLITDFGKGGIVLDQVFVEDDDTSRIAVDYIGQRSEGAAIKHVDIYKGIEIDAVCPACGMRSVARELDTVPARNIKEVPVVPLLVCKKCGKKFYSLSEEYLEKLVAAKKSLFSTEEQNELSNDKSRFVNELNEYIIRIFASKKIMRIAIKR